MKKSLIGFSLSLCIKDIIEGRVKAEDVHFIQTGCAPRNQQDVFELLAAYADTYWGAHRDKALRVVQELMEDHRIGWASAFEKNTCNIAWGHWLTIPGRQEVERDHITDGEIATMPPYDC
jgi:hypothetical protein